MGSVQRSKYSVDYVQRSKYSVECAQGGEKMRRMCVYMNVCMYVYI